MLSPLCIQIDNDCCEIVGKLGKLNEREIFHWQYNQKAPLYNSLLVTIYLKDTHRCVKIWDAEMNHKDTNLKDISEINCCTKFCTKDV